MLLFSTNAQRNLDLKGIMNQEQPRAGFGGHGYAAPTPATKYEGTRWHIPGGCDYHNAQVVSCYFETEEEAKAFESAYRYPPEMAEYHSYDPSKIRQKKKELTHGDRNEQTLYGRKQHFRI